MTRIVKILLILSVVLTLAAPVVGLFFTVISMGLTFNDLSKSPNGIANPQQLAQHIGFTLEATAAGLIFSAIGIILLIVIGVMVIFKKPSPNSN